LQVKGGVEELAGQAEEEQQQGRAAAGEPWFPEDAGVDAECAAVVAGSLRLHQHEHRKQQEADQHGRQRERARQTGLAALDDAVHQETQPEQGQHRP
jgi:hypothetical protein